MIDIQPNLSGPLNSALQAREFAISITSLILARNDTVKIDFAAVERMTPSFANVFVKTLLERIPLNLVRTKLDMQNRAPHVIEAMNRAAAHYLSNGQNSNNGEFVGAVSSTTVTAPGG